MISGTAPKRVIRLFISSTFDDFTEERNLLVKKVYPELRDYCEERGFSFHPIDLRWGVSRENSLLHHTVRICLEEIDRCKSLSPYVNFFIMVGDRYGWQPLPETIRREDWERIIRELPPRSPLEAALNAYYAQDLNDPAEPFCLRSQQDIDQANLTGTDEKAVRQQLFELLRGQGREPVLPEDDPFLWQCVASATEQEITSGYFRGEDRSRRNTFILLRSDGNNTDTTGRIARLKERLSTDAQNTNRSQVHSITPKDGTDWITTALTFLEAAIQEQIDQYPQEEEKEETEKRILQEEYERIDAAYLPLPAAEECAQYIRAHTGQILLTGGSGSGKSWFLKHYASQMATTCSVAAVFNDVQPRGRGFLSALEMLLGVLRANGALEAEAAPPDADDPAGWFESELLRIKPTGKRVLLILDSVNRLNMPDYLSAPGKSLFGLRLPPNVTMIVSAVSDDDLRECDKAAVTQGFGFRPLSGQERTKRFFDVMQWHGRRLTKIQIAAVWDCLQRSEELGSALAIGVLGQVCAGLRSWEPFPAALRGCVSFRDLVRFALFYQGRDDYTVLRRHTLAFIALSVVGLTESELIDLLTEDPAVREEIRQQAPASAKHASDYDRLPVVLWAIQYSELKPFLTDINDDGTLLLQLRHTRLREEILAELEEAGETRQELLAQMTRYYAGQDWLFPPPTDRKATPPAGQTPPPGEEKARRNARKEASPLSNRRKVQELIPLYEALARYDNNVYRQISDQLSQPLCVDAFVRCGALTAVKRYLSQYGTQLLSARMLLLLRQKDLLLRLWPDSFLPAAVQSLYPEEASATERQAIRALLERSCHSHYLRQPAFHGGNGEVFFPLLQGKCRYALHADARTAAVISNGTLWILDLVNAEQLTFCPSVREECFLYWQDDSTLKVRCARKRLRYVYTNAQLYPQGTAERCADWGDLLDEKKLAAAGGWTEAEHFGICAADPTWIIYRKDGQAVHQQVYEPYARTLSFRVHQTLAALIIDSKKLIVTEMTGRRKLYERVLPDITEVDWSPGGRLLVVIRGNTLLTVDPFRDRAGAPLSPIAAPDSNYLRQKLEGDGARISRGFYNDLKTLAFTSRRDYCGPEGPSDAALFGAFSAKYRWFAVYQYTAEGAKARFFNFSACGEKSFFTGDERIIQVTLDVPAITFHDCEDGETPFRVAADRSGLVLKSNGKWFLYDLEKGGKKTEAPASALTPPLPEDRQTIRRAYAKALTKRLRLGEQEKPACRRKEKTDAIRKLLFRERLKQPDVFRAGGYYWLADKDRGLVHLYDGEGKRLCGEQTESRILAADTQGESLFLLLATNRVVCLSPVRGAPSGRSF